VPDRLLIDGHGRRQSFDVLHLGLLHPPQELPSVAGEALQEAPLPLLVERVVGEAGLAGAGYAGEGDQCVTGDLQVQPLEVVLPGPPDNDLVCADPTCHARLLLRTWGVG
jgi:hypothetical protein